MKTSTKLALLALTLVLASTSMYGCAGGCREYHRDQDFQDAENDGKSELIRAESAKKVAVETAKANLESAKLNAEADIIRANGIAKANQIIGASLENNKAYLEWLWIDNIEKNPNAVFYIPTENKVPIFMNSTHIPPAAKEKK